VSLPPESEEWVVLGKISGIYGVRGMVKVFSFTDLRDAILDYSPWFLGSELRPYVLEEGRMQGEGVVAKLAEVSDREQARALIGQEIRIARKYLPDLEPGEYYWRDLIGMRVQNLEGQFLGNVKSFLETGANDVMVLDGEKSGELLIPWSDTSAAGVDQSAGLITVDWQADW